MKKILVLAVIYLTSIHCYGQSQPGQTTTTTPPPPVKSGDHAKSVGLYVFPAKDQSKETQVKDDDNCYNWAIQQSGYDPANPPKVVANTVSTDPDGTAVKGAAKGAAAGLAIGSIGGEAGKGAAVGAIAGGLAGRKAKKQGDAQQQQANNQAAAAKSADLLNDFKKAFTVCLEGKGYTVK